MRTPSLDAVNDAANRLEARINDAGAVADSENQTDEPQRVQPLMRTVSLEAMADAAARLEAEKDDGGSAVGHGENLRARRGTAEQPVAPMADAATRLEAEKDGIGAQSRITGTSESRFEGSCYAVQPHGDGTATVVLDWYETSEGRDFMMRDIFMRTEIEAARKIVRILDASFAHVTLVRTEHHPVDEETWSAWTSS